MATPEMTTVGGWLYDSLGPLAEPYDERRGYPLATFADALGGMFQPVLDIVDDPDKLLDPNRAPVGWLSWLGQFVPGGSPIRAPRPGRERQIAPNPSAESDVLEFGYPEGWLAYGEVSSFVSSSDWATDGDRSFYLDASLSPEAGFDHIGWTLRDYLPATPTDDWRLTVDFNILEVPNSAPGTPSDLNVTLSVFNSSFALLAQEHVAVPALGVRTVSLTMPRQSNAAWINIDVEVFAGNGVTPRRFRGYMDNVRLYVGLPEDEDSYRAAVLPDLQDPPSRRRGTVPAIVEEVQRFLNEPRTVYTVERQGGNMYIGAISVINSQIKSGYTIANIQARVNAVQPAGRIITVTGITGDNWQALRDTHTDWADVRSTFSNWAEVRSNPTKQ